MSSQDIALPVVVAFGGYVFAVAPATGDILWEHDMGAHSPRIIVTETRVFAGGSTLICVAYPSGELIWQQKQFVDREASFILSDDRLFAGTAGTVACYSALDGKLLWTNKFSGKGSAPVALATPFTAMQTDNNT